MSGLRSADLLWYGSASDVAVLRWPQQEDERSRLDQLGLPRLLLVEPADGPPECASCLEDWIRVPAADGDIRARLVALGEHAARHPRVPTVDPWGELSFHDGRVFLSPREQPLALLLVQHFGSAVPDADLVKQVWPDGDGSPTALRVHVHRLRKRIKSLRLSITTIRAYGYMMSEVHEGR